MPLVLYDYWRSSAAYRVRIALALKGVAYERVAVNLIAGDQRGAANRAVNPQGFVPTLVADGVAMTQSLAIVDWLDATCPDPPLIPRDPAARARAWAMALTIAADIHPIDNLRVLKRLEAQFGADQAARDAWYVHWVGEGLDALEQMAPATRFLGGATPGVADLCLVPQMYNARRFGMTTTRWPRLAAADAAACALAAFADAHPDRVRPA
jgi:maleylacetoacetate isomerase